MMKIKLQPKQSVPPSLRNVKLNHRNAKAKVHTPIVPSLCAPVAHIINIVIQLAMTPNRLIHRQHQLLPTELRALIVHVFLRHLNQTLVLTQPSLLQFRRRSTAVH